MRRAVFSRVAAIALVAWLAAMLGTSSAQEWVKLREEGANFYEIQRSFNQYWEGREVEKGKGWKQYKRWEYWTAPRVYLSGILPEPDMNTRAFQQYLQRHGGLMKGAATSASVATAIPAANWTSLGPNAWVRANSGSVAPGLGRVSAIAFHPTNSSIIFLGTPAGGLWKSTDAGATWSTNTDNLTVLGISAIVIDPTNPNIMYIATGDYDSNDTYSIGVLKSTDGGATWNTTGLNWTVTQSRTISKLLMHPTNSSILLAATSSGVWKTTDAGVTWTNKITGNYKDMEFKPGDPATVYLASGLSFRRSTNTGDNWTSITLPISGFNRINIGVSPANASYVYLFASKSTDSGFLGLCRSTDSGVSFITQSTAPNILGYNCGIITTPPAFDTCDPDQTKADAGGQGFYDLAFAVSPTNADEIYTGGVNIWKSTDGGVNWTRKTHWIYNTDPAAYVHADVHHLEFNGSNLYTGTDGGFFKSTDGGTTWTDLSAGMNSTQFYRIGSYAGSANLVYGGAQDNTISRYTGSTTWESFKSGDGAECIVDPTNSSIVYMATQGGSLNRSTNAGATFSSIKSNINESGAWVTPYVMDPLTNTTLYAGYVNVWKTTTSGVGASAWTKLSAFANTATIVDLQVAPSNSNYMYVVKSINVYRTTDGGANWTDITAGLPTASYTRIAVAGNDPQKIWITMSGYNNGNKVYASTDGGTTWANYSGTLPNLPFNTIVYHNNGGTDALYAGADVGVYYRDATMSDWELYQTGLPNVPINELEVHQNSGNLRAATFGRGMWETPLVPPPGAALAFDGVDDFVLVPDAPALNFESGLKFTIEAWVKMDVDGSVHPIVAKGVVSGASRQYFLDIPSTVTRFLVVGPPAQVAISIPAITVAEGWVHLAGVLDVSQNLMQLYKNGVLAGSATPPTALASTTEPLLIGALKNIVSSPTPTFFHNGKIDEVRIWNVARSQADIQAKMNCELTGTEAGLVVYYRFNHGVADGANAGVTTLTDIAGGDNNGTLNDFALSGTSSNWTAPGGVTSGTSCTVAALAANAGNDLPHSGGATKLNGSASGGSGGYTYAWAIESGPNTGSEQFSSAGKQDPIFTPAAKGSYVLRFTVNDGKNATAADNVAVTVNVLLAASISGDDPVSPGSTHTYTVSTDASSPTYLWTVTNGTIVGDNDQSSVEIEAGGPQSDMLVEVLVTDGVTNDAVYALKSVTVTNPFALTADAGPDRTITQGTSTTLGGSPTAISGIEPFTYEWSPTTGLNDPSAANPVAQPASTTTYTLTVTDSWGSIATDQVTVTVANYVLLSDGYLKINKNKDSKGNIHSNNKIEFMKGAPGTHVGDLTAKDDITIQTKNTIQGNATAGDELYLFGTATVTGDKQAHASVATIPLPTFAYTAGGANVTVPANGSQTLTPGSFGVVKVSSNGTLFLSAGDYYMNSLEASSAAILSIDASSGPVNVYVVNSLKFGGSAQVQITGGASDAIQFVALQTAKLVVGSKAILYGTLMAPNAQVQFAKESKIKGAVYASSISLDALVKFYHHTSPGPFPKDSEFEGSEDANQEPVTSYQLEQNYPNPFNPTTTIRFALPEANHVQLAIYNTMGQLVKQVVNGEFESGWHQAVWDGKNDLGQRASSGVYLYVIKAGEFTAQRKLVLMK